MPSNRPQVLAMSVALIAAAGFLAVPAHAQNRYKWRDAGGQMHYSDTLTREAMIVGYEVVNNQGLTVKRVARQLTADEKVEAAKAAAIRKAELEAAAEQKRRDKQLLAAYPTEADLVASQKAQLEQLNQIVRAAQAGLQNQEETLADLLGRADELQHRGSAVPKRLNEQIAELRAQLEQQRVFQASKQAEHDKAALNHQSQLDHYRSLQAKPPQP